MSQWKVDIREPPELVAFFKDKGAKVEMLESGDYTFADLVAFERKSDDFLDMERMFVQVDEMIDRFPFAFLIVERKLEDIIALANRNYHRNMLPVILGAVASLSVRGCPPIFFGNQTLMLTTMEKMAAKCVDGKDRSSKRLLRTRNLDQRGNVAVNVLRAFGVGSGRAEDIAEKFGDVGTILDILKNEPERFKEVVGVGDKTIVKIRESFKKKEPNKMACPFCKAELTAIEYKAMTTSASDKCPKCGLTWF